MVKLFIKNMFLTFLEILETITFQLCQLRINYESNKYIFKIFLKKFEVLIVSAACN